MGHGRVMRAFLLLVCLCGCGAATPASQTQVNVTNVDVTNVDVTNVNVTQVSPSVNVAWGSRGPEEVDFQDARLRRAIDESERLLGHAITLRFDVQMMPRPVAHFFDAFFDHEVGLIPQDLARLEERDPEVFKFGQERLTEIHFDYDGSMRQPEVRFDPSAGVLYVKMNGGVPGGLMSYAFREAFDAYYDARFDSVDAAQVQLQDRAPFLRWLERRGFRGDRARRGFAVQNATVLWSATARTGGAFHDALSEWLVDRVSFYTNDYGHHADELGSLADDDPWRAGEQAYTAWLNAAWPSLDDQAQRKLLDAMYMRRSGPGREQDPYLREPFPGVDLFALSLGVVDRWIAAGRPTPQRVSSRDHTQRLFDFVVCAPRQGDRRRFDSPRCDHDFYRHASTDPDLRGRLFSEILQRRDTALTQALFANLKWLSSPYTLIAWRTFEDAPEQWAAATFVLAELTGYSRQNLRSEIYDDSVRIWRQSRASHGPLLYLLAAISDRGRGGRDVVPWAEFRRVFGSLASAADFEAFLGYGGDALVRMADVWPALADPRAAVASLTSPLSQAMGDDELRRRHQGFPHSMLRDLITYMKSAHQDRALRLLGRFFKDRAEQYPSEERALGTLIQMIER